MLPPNTKLVKIRKPADPNKPSPWPVLPSENAWRLYELALEYHRQEQLAVQDEKAKKGNPDAK